MAFHVYKPGQGRYARITCGVLLGLLVAYGCVALKGTLSDVGYLPFTVGGISFSYAQVVPVLLFVALVATLAWGLNYPKFADFLIETEVEMTRVAWPTRKAVIGSSVVVIVTVIVMSGVLFGVDRLFIWLLTVGGLY